MNIKPRSIILGFICLVAAASLTIGGFLIFKRTSPAPTTEVSQPAPEPSGPPYKFNYQWATASPYIAHAFGSIDGDNYTNSYEAFLLNYQLGHRIFEVDFSITDDGYTVLAHDAEGWRERATVQADSDINPSANTPPPATDFTYANFMSSLWYGKYHPLDVADLFQLMADYPDIYIVTDTKYFDAEHVTAQFSEFVDTARQIDEHLLERLIPQIYFPEMLAYIMDIYPWKSVIYTLYKNYENWTPENVLSFAEASGVKFITLWGSWSSQEALDLWHAAGLKVAAHTINNLNVANQLRARGVDLFYTDFLLP